MVFWGTHKCIRTAKTRIYWPIYWSQDWFEPIGLKTDLNRLVSGLIWINWSRDWFEPIGLKTDLNRGHHSSHTGKRRLYTVYEELLYLHTHSTLLLHGHTHLSKDFQYMKINLDMTFTTPPPPLPPTTHTHTPPPPLPRITHHLSKDFQ